jgi:hypothetical protein
VFFFFIAGIFGILICGDMLSAAGGLLLIKKLRQSTGVIDENHSDSER